ncbi:hypothetical protein C4A75_23655 [Brevibacillus laterosporus]|nr:hypothetical protein C4A75_23655 [Brevibacillus laterosporus]
MQRFYTSFIRIRNSEKLIIEEGELAEFCDRISDSRQYATLLQLATKGDRGVIETAPGWIEKLDTTSQQIKLKNDKDFC